MGDIQNIVEEFCNQLRQSIHRAVATSSSLHGVPLPSTSATAHQSIIERPIVAPTVAHQTSMEQEVRRLFPSINRRQFNDLYQSNSKKRKRPNKDKPTILKKDVILLRHPQEKRTLIGLRKSKAYEDGKLSFVNYKLYVQIIFLILHMSEKESRAQVGKCQIL